MGRPKIQLPPVDQFPVRLLFDNNMTVKGFRWCGYEIVSSGHFEGPYPFFSARGWIYQAANGRTLGDIGDEAILGEAFRTRRVLATQDQGFRDYTDDEEHPHAGIILLPARLGARHQAELCLRVAITYAQLLNEEAVVIDALQNPPVIVRNSNARWVRPGPAQSSVAYSHCHR